ncbi:MAG: type II toxin-antitoxin system HicA family toxin [Minisyncoccia bacterium]
MPSASARKLCALLERNRFVLKRQKGSHRIYTREEDSRRTIVPMHSGDLPIGTLRKILLQAGLSLEDL